MRRPRWRRGARRAGCVRAGSACRRAARRHLWAERTPLPQPRVRHGSGQCAHAQMKARECARQGRGAEAAREGVPWRGACFAHVARHTSARQCESMRSVPQQTMMSAALRPRHTARSQRLGAACSASALRACAFSARPASLTHRRSRGAGLVLVRVRSAGHTGCRSLAFPSRLIEKHCSVRATAPCRDTRTPPQAAGDGDSASAEPPLEEVGCVRCLDAVDGGHGFLFHRSALTHAGTGFLLCLTQR